jgi:hypothetical protein
MVESSEDVRLKAASRNRSSAATRDSAAGNSGGRGSGCLERPALHDLERFDRQIVDRVRSAVHPLAETETWPLIRRLSAEPGTLLSLVRGVRVSYFRHSSAHPRRRQCYPHVGEPEESPAASITLFEFLRWVPRRMAERAVRSLPSRKSESSDQHAMDI